MRGSQLCRLCWEESQLLDPVDRCVHCFELSDTKLCWQCAKKPYLPYPRMAVFPKEAPILRLVDESAISAMAAFVYYQWRQLGKQDPDVIIPIVPSQIGATFAELCQKPYLNLLKRRFANGSWQLRSDGIEMDQMFLLFDPGCKAIDLRAACFAVSEAFPKRVNILSLKI